MTSMPDDMTEIRQLVDALFDVANEEHRRVERLRALIVEAGLTMEPDALIAELDRLSSANEVGAWLRGEGQRLVRAAEGSSELWIEVDGE